MEAHLARRAAFHVILLSSIVAGRVEGADAIRLRLPAGDVEVLSRLEIVLEGVSLPGNPFDPDEAAVDAEVRCPSGRTYSLPGFWYGGFERSLRDGREKLEKVGDASWRLRVLPTEAGTHAVRVSAKSHGKEVGSGSVEFDVRAARHRGLAPLPSPARERCSCGSWTGLTAGRTAPWTRNPDLARACW
jgi:hypothetical protein